MKYCRKCGNQLSDDAKFCGSCGTEVINFDSDSSEETDSKKNNKNKVIFFIILAATLCALIIEVGLIVNNKRQVKNYENCISMAEKYVEELNYEQAEAFYLKAIEIDMKQREPYIELAKIYVEQQEYEKAKDILEEADKNGAEKTDETAEEEKEIEEKIDASENMIDYSWVVEPTIEADAIFYLADYPDLDHPLNETSKQADNPNAVVQAGSQLGVIDLSGELLTEIAYKEISAFDKRYMMIRTTPQYSEEYEMDWEIYWLRENGEVVASVGNGSLDLVVFYYYEGKIYCTYNDLGFYPEEISVPDCLIPVQEAEQRYSMDADDEWWNNLSEKYAISKNGKLITDFIYDECGSYSDGLMAVCKDGKWGYVDENGEIVIPIEYDASWKHYPPFEGGANRSSKNVTDYCYAASDSYVVLCKDNEWQIRDTSGNFVIPSGVFEEILPVFDGKCWVKMDGKWGVIQLGNTVNTEKESEETDEETDVETRPKLTAERTFYSYEILTLTGTVMEETTPLGTAYLLKLDEPAKFIMKSSNEVKEYDYCEDIQIWNTSQASPDVMGMTGKHVSVSGMLYPSEGTEHNIRDYMIGDAFILVQ